MSWITVLAATIVALGTKELYVIINCKNNGAKKLDFWNGFLHLSLNGGISNYKNFDQK